MKRLAVPVCTVANASVDYAVVVVLGELYASHTCMFCKLNVFVFMCNLQTAHLHVPLFMKLNMKLPKHFVSMLIGM